MEPRLILLIPLLASLVVAVGVYSRHSLSDTATMPATHTIAKVYTPTKTKAHTTTITATSHARDDLDSVSEALKKAAKKRVNGVGLEELKQLVSEDIAQNAAPNTRGWCEARSGAWYGNRTHICWQDICTLITPWHRYVFYAIAAQLRSSVELLKGFNETLDGCVIVPGYAEEALKTAEEIERLAENNITGCSYVKMVILLKSFQSYVEKMSPSWQRLSMNCAEKKHDTKQVKDLLNWLSARTREALEELQKRYRVAVGNMQKSRDQLEEWWEEKRSSLQQLSEAVNRSVERSAGSLQEELERYRGGLEELQKKLENLTRAVNTSTTWLIGEADNLADRFKSLEGELGRLQEELDRLGQRLNITLNLTLPGERG